MGEELGVEVGEILTCRSWEFCASELFFLLTRALLNLSPQLELFV